MSFSIRKESQELVKGQSDTNSTSDPLEHWIFNCLPRSKGSDQYEIPFILLCCATASGDNEMIKNTDKRRQE